MLYTALYMASMRTQVYFTAEQREALDELARREHSSLAGVVRRAVDRYLAQGSVDVAAALDATFGAVPDLEVPSRDEWDRD